MPFNIYDSGEDKKEKKITSISPGVVVGKCDLLRQGKVLVRIPATGVEVWARPVAPGAREGRGLMSPAKEDDEVLVAYNQDDPNDAYLLGGMWSTRQPLPADTQLDIDYKLVLRTGTNAQSGHLIELDDLQQSITIQAATGQEIKLSRTGIEIQANSTTVINLTAPPDGGTSVIQIQAGSNTIEMGPSGIDINATNTLNLTAPTINIQGTSMVSIKGANVAIN